MNYILRDYQKELSQKAVEILRSKNIVYLSMEVRTGKTLTSLETAKLYGAKRVLFLTKKKAIQSILDEYNNFCYSESFELFVIKISIEDVIEDVVNGTDNLIKEIHLMLERSDRWEELENII